MLVERNGVVPRVDAGASVAPTAIVVGDVAIADGCYLGHGVVIESGGPPVRLERDVVVMANTVVRSLGGNDRPAFPVRLGARTLIGPQCALAGCRLAEDCYVATQVMVFQGVEVGAAARLGAGSIVHVRTQLPPRTRLGLRQMAVPSSDGPLITSDVEAAREALAEADFFGEVFGLAEDDQEQLHRRAAATLRAEALAWADQSEASAK
jgi:carbonic anhydrase/acetyltransferase-like protein (isoleucine patch superfamily)